MGNGLNAKSSSSPMNNTNKRSFAIAYDNTGDGNQSPGKVIDEQRKKAFFQRKTEMLSNFEVGDK